MGIISVIILVVGVAFFISASRRIDAVAEEEGDENVAWGLKWAARVSAIVAVCGVVGVVDAYIYELPSPFRAPEADLPERHLWDAPAERPEIREVAKPDPMKDAREEHAGAMEDFETRTEK